MLNYNTLNDCYNFEKFRVESCRKQFYSLSTSDVWNVYRVTTIWQRSRDSTVRGSTLRPRPTPAESHRLTPDCEEGHCARIHLGGQ
ncbi:jg11494 [Pararge aegeria aegeria]|uniref:Jg11494 protein n=1 Tax=Pararge aegeria aegeria TaxID=348720 RepID=A0A8S4RNG3_9NEOP|nr:jg11494 [Pararge aegeria aegeria]